MPEGAILDQSPCVVGLERRQKAVHALSALNQKSDSEFAKEKRDGK